MVARDCLEEWPRTWAKLALDQFGKIETQMAEAGRAMIKRDPEPTVDRGAECSRRVRRFGLEARVDLANVVKRYERRDGRRYALFGDAEPATETCAQDGALVHLPLRDRSDVEHVQRRKVTGNARYAGHLRVRLAPVALVRSVHRLTAE